MDGPGGLFILSDRLSILKEKKKKEIMICHC